MDKNPSWGWFLFATVIFLGNAVNVARRDCPVEASKGKPLVDHPMDDAVDYQG